MFSHTFKFIKRFNQPFIVSRPNNLHHNCDKMTSQATIIFKTQNAALLRAEVHSSTILQEETKRSSRHSVKFAFTFTLGTER